MKQKNQLPFSQRNGLSEIPPQLGMGEISPQLRKQLNYYAQLEVDRNTVRGPYFAYFGKEWDRFTKDVVVLHLDRDVSEHVNRKEKWQEIFQQIFLTDTYYTVFDFVEFILGHKNYSNL